MLDWVKAHKVQCKKLAEELNEIYKNAHAQELADYLVYLDHGKIHASISIIERYNRYSLDIFYNRKPVFITGYGGESTYLTKEQLLSKLDTCFKRNETKQMQLEL